MWFFIVIEVYFFEIPAYTQNSWETQSCGTEKLLDFQTFHLVQAIEELKFVSYSKLSKYINTHTELRDKEKEREKER